MTILAFILFSIITIGVTGCDTLVSNVQSEQITKSQTKELTSKELIEIDGKVVYMQLEGGFWGIIANDGKHYDPGSLPAEFQKDGLKVSIKANLVKNMMTFRMWGKLISIVDINGVRLD